MHLKKLELIGFKSFAKKTEIFFEKGVTCIVGPNGCGKSNVSDSIRWVLGERSAKMLRGSKMEDVIFQGTDSRDPINFAEVTITIDNSDHALPIQYDEVAITRRLYRSGESEYMINRTLCRLKDVQNLILDTGVGSNSYSMIEQGRIDYILTAEAEERRFLIEEAAGISKYKVKKDEAVRKLDQTDQNLLRLNDIIAEVERNIKYAERQAKRAEQYKVHFEKLKELELQMLAGELLEIENQKKEVESGKQFIENDIRVVQESLNGVLGEFIAAEQAARAAEQEFIEAEQSRIQFEQKLLSIQREREMARERFHETKSSIERAAEELKQTDETIQRSEKEIGLKEVEFVSLQEVHKQLSADKLNIENQSSELDQLISERSADLSRIGEENFDLAARLARARNELQETLMRISSIQDRKKYIVNNLAKLNSELSTMKSDHARIDAEIFSRQQNIHTQSGDILKSSEDREQADRELQALQIHISELRDQKVNSAHRLEILKNLDGSGFVNIKEMLETMPELQEKYHDVRGLLDLLEVQEEYEVAVAAVLLEHTKAVVAQNPKSAANLIQELKTKGCPQASVLICDQVSESQAPAPISHPLIRERLIQAIKIQPGYEKLFQNLLGDVYLVEDLHESNVEELVRLAKNARLVTKHGICLGSEFHLTLRNSVALPIKDYREREKEKSVLIDEIKNLGTQIVAAEQKKAELENIVKSGQVSLKRGEEGLVAQQIQLKQMETARENLVREIERHQSEIELETCELYEKETDETELGGRQHRTQAELDQLAGIEADLKIRTDSANSEILKLKRQKEELLISLTRALTQFETHEDTERRFQESLNLLKSTFEAAKSRQETLNRDVQEFTERLEKLQTQTENLLAQEKTVQSDLVYSISKAQQKNERRNELFVAKNQLEIQKTEFQNQINDERTKLHDLEKRIMELQYKKQAAIDRVNNTYQLSVAESEMGAQEEAIDREKMTAAIQELKKKVELCGTVNLLAIEEYEEMKQRFDFLSTQKKDLETSKDELIEAIRKINRTTKQLFEETLTKVREMFKAYFKILFNGGEADLVLVDEQNPLDSGIDIVARPPGKKPQHISLLSGGEKALTAIALLFALFRIKPSPFCVLDEIDAPLDEANNERFVHVVREFLQTTQFIIITHSRKTISMGDSLYGVTMEEAGVSKLVSVKVSQGTWAIEHENEKVRKELNEIIQ